MLILAVVLGSGHTSSHMTHEPGVGEESAGGLGDFPPLVSIDLRVVLMATEAVATAARLIARVQSVEALLVHFAHPREGRQVLLEQDAQIVEVATEYGEIPHGLPRPALEDG